MIKLPTIANCFPIRRESLDRPLLYLVINRDIYYQGYDKGNDKKHKTT